MTVRSLSYRRLMALPVFGLFAEDGELVATIRAHDAYEARWIFRVHGLSGARVRRIASG